MVSAETLNDYRVVPRLMVVLFGVLVWIVADWFMGLKDPNTQQAAFVSTMMGTLPAVFAFYVNSGKRE